MFQTLGVVLRTLVATGLSIHAALARLRSPAVQKSTPVVVPVTTGLSFRKVMSQCHRGCPPVHAVRVSINGNVGSGCPGRATIIVLEEKPHSCGYNRRCIRAC
jgi:hypothetical protein